MCIIVAKKKGIKIPDKEILNSCFLANNDGAGMMFNDGKQVHILKGYMTFEEFYNTLIDIDNRYNLIDKDLILHFRISTSGSVDKGNCHPYPLRPTTEHLRSLNCTTNIGMAHNGIIKKHTPPQESILNDTQTFIKNYVFNMYEKNINFLDNHNNIKLLEAEAESKLAFLTSDNMYLIGNFINDNDIYYSNYSYMNYLYNYDNDYLYINDIDYIDLFDLDGKPLDLELFCEILEDNQDIHYINDKNILYENQYIFELNYNNFSFNYLYTLNN